MADNQFDQPGYEGFMGYTVVTLPTLLRDAGYHTYMAGKWHLGKTKKSIPAARGFERSISLMESGADNFEKKSYLPLYTIFVQHWRVIVCLSVVFMVAVDCKDTWQTFILGSTS